MKYYKILASLLMVIGLWACSNNDDELKTNSISGATVSMQQDEIAFKENRNLVNVPVKVTGERNGIVTVTCTVQEVSGSPAMEDVHYLMTSKTINIAQDDEVGYFEIKLVDDFDINEPREFVITLVQAEGATIGAPNTTIVTLKDNDSLPYDRLGGVWYVSCDDGEGPTVREVEFVSFDDGEAGYGKRYLLYGLIDGGNFTPKGVPVNVNYSFNEMAETGSLTIKYGQKLVDVDLSDYGYGNCSSFLAYFVGSNSFSDSGSIVYTWNEDMTELEVVSKPEQTPTPEFVLMLQTEGGSYLYLDRVTDVFKFTRMKP